jgi:DNA-binding response OmpR family regulator
MSGARRFYIPFIKLQHSGNTRRASLGDRTDMRTSSSQPSRPSILPGEPLASAEAGPELCRTVRPLVYVVEDDTDIARLLQHNLESAGFAVRQFGDASNVMGSALAETPALFLLDVMLPGTNGFDLCRQIRQSEYLCRVPVIFLTARTSEADKVRGLELGGDDYVAKPFSPRELLARVRAVLRHAQPPKPSTLRLGTLEIDPSAMTVSVQGRPVLVTALEFRLLEYLAEHPGRVFTRDQLLDAVWRQDVYVTPRSVDVYVWRLREKIEANSASPQFLKTVRGVGYRFDVPRS